jgi:uncharacterized membrane protein YczE
MLRTIGAQIALLTFTLAVVAGVAVGNSPITVLTRGLISMVAALVVGQIAAVVCKVVLRDHLQKRKHGLDLAHVAALNAATTEHGTVAASDDAERTYGGNE